MTRMQRPPGAKALTLSEAEAPILERRLNDEAARAQAADLIGQLNSEWLDGSHLARLQGQVRTSWIVDPPDGQAPYSAAGKKLFTEHQADVTRAYDGPEVRPATERCLLGSGGANSPPLLNASFASNYQIVQGPDAIAIVSEMNHDVRIIRLNSLHAPPQLRAWMGDSIGRWEGDTLVVETAGFKPQESFRNQLYLSADAKVTERFTRVAVDEIRYDFSVEDPDVFTQVWRGEIPFRALKGQIYEFACHEGNYSLPGILGGARVDEARAATGSR